MTALIILAGALAYLTVGVLVVRALMTYLPHQYPVIRDEDQAEEDAFYGTMTAIWPVLVLSAIPATIGRLSSRLAKPGPR